jgi:hypothetical protein
MMGKAITGVVLLLTTTSLFSSAPKRDYVPDEKAAVVIGEAVLKPIYGEKQIIGEEPFHATLKEGVWTVTGTLTCSDGKGGRTNSCNGGVAVLTLSKEDGRILSVIHYK